MTDDKDLDALFGQASAQEPSPTLMARVVLDADFVQAQLARKRIPEPASKSAWWADAVAAIGGWSAVSGITAAGVMGLAVGLYSPDAVAALTGGETPGSYELAPDLSGLWTEDGDV